MAEITERFGLEKPALDDYYDIRQYCRNLDRIDALAAKGMGTSTPTTTLTTTLPALQAAVVDAQRIEEEES